MSENISNGENKILLLWSGFIFSILGFVTLQLLDFSKVFYINTIIHSLILVIMAAMSFYVSYLSYKTYKNKKESRLFIFSLSFYSFGLASVAHTFFVFPNSYTIDVMFSVIEHLGTLIGSVFLGWLLFTSGTLDENIYRRRWLMMLSLNLIFVLLAIISLFLSGAVDFLENILGVLVLSVTVLFFLSVIFLFYRSDKMRDHSLILYMILGLFVLFSSGVIHLFYDKWNVIWWYSHSVVFVWFIVVSFSFLRGRFLGKNNLFDNVFGKIPLYSTLSTKIILLILFITIVPILSISYFTSVSYKETFSKQTVDSIVLINEAHEGQLLAFIDLLKNRTADFSSDGFIIDSLDSINKDSDNKKLAQSLSEYLKSNKMPVNEYMSGINIMNSEGVIISSTADSEVGKDESEESYFNKALQLDYGEVDMGDYGDVHHFGLIDRPSIVVFSSPLISKKTGEKIGVISNYFDARMLDVLLSGEYSERLGSLSMMDKKTVMEVNLINRDKVMISNSKFLERDVFLKKVVDTDPVMACILEGKEIRGQWINYRGEKVYGSSMCFGTLNWVLITEVNEIELFRSFDALRKDIISGLFILVMVIVFVGIYFSRRLIKPLEMLVVASERISKGDWQTVEKKSSDEIGILSETFNTMVLRLMSVDKMKSDFVSIASHQLRTPLTAIKLFAEMLKDSSNGSLNEDQRSYINDLSESTEHMIKLVNDLLNVSRLETGRLKIEPELTQYEDFIQGVINSLEFLAKSKGCEIIFNSPYERMPEIMIDRSLMTEVVNNLLINSIRYSLPNRCFIVVDLKREGGEYVLSIKDSGIGIPERDQSRIFEKFFRADNAIKAQTEGSGLGMYVVKMIIETYGGRVWFESVEGKGTIFYVTIPEKGMVEKKGERSLAK